MNFLKTLFWVLLAVFLALFARANWSDVTLNLWGDIQLDIKIPVLVALAALLAFVPTFLVQRAKLWTMRRRVEAFERQRPASAPPAREGAGDSAAAP